MCENYQGWENRETWALMLNVNNDQGLEEQANEITLNAFNEYLESIESGLENVEDDRMGAICSARDAFQEWAESFFTHAGHTFNFGSPRSERLQEIAEDIGSFYRVDWYECAENLLEDRLREFDAEHSTTV